MIDTANNTVSVEITTEILARATVLCLEQSQLTAEALTDLPDRAQQQFQELVWMTANDMIYNQGRYFRPFPHQLRFFATGSTHTRRGLIAANRSGKSLATCYEASYHLTGWYPEWWPGRRWEDPVRIFAAGESWQQVALVLQRELLGTDDIRVRARLGTGAIPRSAIIEDSIRADGPNCLAVEVRHTSGGTSTLLFGNYTQEARNMQGFKLHMAIFDEQPPDAMFSELTTRTATLQGQVLCSFTPLKGLTGLVRRFWERVEGYTHVRVGWADLPEYDPWGQPFFLKADRDQLERDYLPHEREARTQGIPVMGVGAVFPLLSWPTYTPTALNLEDWPDWPRVISLDLGLIRDSTVISFMAQDPDTGRIYLHRQRVITGRGEALPEQWLPLLLNPEVLGTPIVLPPDAGRPGVYTLSPESVREYLESHGLNVIRRPIQNPEDSSGRRSNNKSFGINLMRQMMERDEFLVNTQCQEFLDQARNYYVNEAGRYSDPDDAIDSARYGLLALIQGWGEPWSGTTGLHRARERFGKIRQEYGLKTRATNPDAICYDPWR